MDGLISPWDWVCNASQKCPSQKKNPSANKHYQQFIRAGKGRAPFIFTLAVLPGGKNGCNLLRIKSISKEPATMGKFRTEPL